MKKHIPLLLFFIVTFNSCHKDEESNGYNLFQTPLITGYYVRDVTGNTWQAIGIPNVNTGTNINYPNAVGMSVFPNPATSGIFRVYVHAADLNGTSIFVVPAVYNSVPSNASVNNGSVALVGGNSPVASLNPSGSGGKTFQFAGIPKGYYRVYFKTKEHLLWDNLIVIQ